MSQANPITLILLLPVNFGVACVCVSMPCLALPHAHAKGI